MREDLTQKLTHLQDLHRALSQALNRATISLQARQNNNDYKLDMTTTADSLTSFTTTLTVAYKNLRPAKGTLIFKLQPETPLILVSGTLDRNTFVQFSLNPSNLTLEQVQALLGESSDLHDLQAAYLLTVANKSTDRSLHELHSMTVNELQTWHKGLKDSPVGYLLDPLFDQPTHEIARLQSNLRHSGWNDFIHAQSTEQLEEALTSLFSEVLNQLEMQVIEDTPAPN